MSQFNLRSIKASEQFGMFSNKENTANNWPPSSEKFESYVDSFFFGLLMPFNKTNGTFAEHVWFTIKYPTLHCLKAIHDTLTLNIRGGILHALAVPFSLIYHLVGLVTRGIVTLSSGQEETIEAFDDTRYFLEPWRNEENYKNDEMIYNSVIQAVQTHQNVKRNNDAFKPS